MQDESIQISNYFGNRLKRLRERAGYSTPESLAKVLGVSRATAYNWEKSERPPHEKYLDGIATALRVDRQVLLGDSSNLDRQSPAEYARETLNKLGKPYPDKEDCLEYLKTFLDRAVDEDPARLGWTWMELFEHFPVDKWK